MEIKRKLYRVYKWEYFWLCVIVIATLIMHFCIITNPSDLILDEQHYIKDARNIIENHETLRAEHPPLGKLIIVAGEYIFCGFKSPVQDSGATLRQSVIGTTNTIIYVDDASVFKVGETIDIDNEYMKIQAIDTVSNQLTVERGFLGTTATSHSVRQPIDHFIDNPWAWRVFPILFGTANIVLFYFLCRRLNMSPTASNIAAFLIALENMTFLMASVAMLDVFCFTFMLGAFLLYVNRRYLTSGIAIGLAGLAKLNGALALPTVFIHWVFTRQGRSRWFVLTILFSIIVFVELMILCDFAITREFGTLTDPFRRINEMMSLSGSLTFATVTHPFASHPWEWLIFYRPMPFWFMPHYTGAINFSTWALIMPTFAYLVYRAVKKDEAGLFALAWFASTFLLWIPATLITDRVSYIYYFYPAVGAICIGMAIGLSRLLEIFRERTSGKLKWTALSVVIFILFMHLVSFLILSPLIPVDFAKLVGLTG